MRILLLLTSLTAIVNSGYSQNWTQLTNVASAMWSGAVSANGAKIILGPAFASDITAINPVYTSANLGITWSTNAVNNLPYTFWASVALSSDGTKLAAANGHPNNGLIYTSPDSGATWQMSNTPNLEWTSIASSSDGTKLVAASADGYVYTSPDSGQTWNLSNLPKVYYYNVTSSADGNKLYVVGGYNGSNHIYTSSDAGNSWVISSLPAIDWSSVACSADGKKLVAVGPQFFIFTSIDSGVSWKSNHLSNVGFSCIASSADGTKLAACGGGVYFSTNSGQSWFDSIAPQANYSTISSSADASELVAVTQNGKAYLWHVPSPGHITVLTNGSGTISPNYSGQLLVIGTKYSLKATAASGFSFVGWTGSITTNNATLQFIMAPNLTFTANFVDVDKPAVTITVPAAGQRCTNATFTAFGTASDNSQVSNVWYRANGLAWTNAITTNAWKNWSAPLDLEPGNNLLEVCAVDFSGNFSTTNSVSFDYIVTSQLQIQSLGFGIIKPNYNNRWLEIGQKYSMRATAVSGFVFTNWLVSTNWIGGVLQERPLLQFIMQSNLTVLATYLDVTKPTITIISPTSGQKMTNALLTAFGTTADNWGVSNVWYKLNDGAWNVGVTTNRYTNWTSPLLKLVAGTNVLSACAVDLAGNLSMTNSVSFVSSNTFRLNMSLDLPDPLTSTGLSINLQTSLGLYGHIQVSTNLATWTALTNFIGTNTTLNFLDSTATNSSQRFYRATIP